jgi:hypothetical protein
MRVETRASREETHSADVAEETAPLVRRRGRPRSPTVFVIARGHELRETENVIEVNDLGRVDEAGRPCLAKRWLLMGPRQRFGQPRFEAVRKG